MKLNPLRSEINTSTLVSGVLLICGLFLFLIDLPGFALLAWLGTIVLWRDLAMTIADSLEEEVTEDSDEHLGF